MSETRKRGVKANQAGIEKLKKAKATERNEDGCVWRYLDIAIAAGVSEKTVKRFFAGVEFVDIGSAETIAIALNLELTDLIDFVPTPTPEPEPPPPTEIDWRAICQQILAEQRQRLAFRKQITGRECGHEANIYVPLGLVKPRTAAKREPNFAPTSDKGTEQYQLKEQEIEKPYQNDEFLQEIIDKPGKNIAIVGEPGAGKTTWLDYIVLHLEDGEYLPILIPLGSLSGQTLAAYLQATWLEEAQKFDNRVGVEELKTLFRSGKVWLLLDGVDEMQLDSGNLPLDVVGKNLSGWVAAARVALTCRLNVWEANPNALGNFDTFRTLQFDDEQVAEFIEQWFEKAGNPAAGQGLQEKLKESGKERIQDLVKNPLRLALLCGTWIFYEGDLPETKAGLYQQFQDNFYQWKPHRKLTNKLSKQRELHGALARLALAAIDQKMPLRKGFVEEVMGADLFELAEEVGWLNLVYWDGKTREPVYAFFHLTFQEYFAALAVEDWHFFLNHFPENPSHADASYRIFELQWKQVILMWLGREDVRKERKEEFIEALIEFDDNCGNYFYADVNKGFYEYRAYWLVAAGITEFKSCTKADEIVDQIVKWGLGYFNIEKQERQTFLGLITEGAKVALPETDRTKAIAALVDVIASTQDHSTRWLAAESLGEIGKDNPTAIAALVDVIASTEDEWTRRLAAASLGEIDKDNPTAIAALVELIASTQSESIRRQAADNLEKIGKDNPTAIAALVDVIASTQDEDIRRQAADNLEKIGKDNPTAIAALVKLIDSTQDRAIRRQAAASLEKIGKDNPTAIAALVKLIDSTQDEYTRRKAAEILGNIGKDNPTAIAALVKLIDSTQDEYTRWLAAASLGRIDKDNPTAIAALVDLISSTQSEDIRWRAAESLGEIGKDNPTAIAALVELIAATQDESTRWLAAYTRRRAAESLGKIGKDNPTAIAALVELIASTQSEDIRWQAAESLGKIGKDNPTAIAALVKLIDSTQDEYTRRRAAESLGKIGKDNPTAIAALVELIASTQSEDIRWQAAESLGKIDKGNPTAIAALVELIASTQDHSTRWQAAESLGKIGKDNPTAIAALVELIASTQSEDIRRQAVKSLEEILTAEQHMAGVVTALKDGLLDETYENDFKRFKACYQVIWHCAQTLPYPKFYQAWHHPAITPHPEVADNIPAGNTPTVQNLEKLMAPLIEQLLPPDNTYLLAIDAATLAGETDSSEIAQRLCNWIFDQIPGAEIPEVEKLGQLERQLSNLKKRLQKTTLALIILPGCSPYPELETFLGQLTSQLQICWLTDAKLAPPLRAISPQQEGLLSAIQSWLDEIG